jgi:hypothetical protein
VVTDDAIRRVVDKAPPLSAQLRASLRDLLNPGATPHRGPIPTYVRPADAAPRVALYRHFDADGILLYVGISRDPGVRRRTHHRRSAWTEFAARETVEWLPDRETAERAEREAIVAERPLFNGAHSTPEAIRSGVEYLIAKGRADLLRFGGRQ